MIERKNIRLPENDYTLGAYFVTLCTKDRKNLFWSTDSPSCSVGADIIRPINLTNCGELVQSAIEQIPRIYNHITVDKYVVMPNHIHMILVLNDGTQGRMISAPTLSTVVGQMKRWCSKQFGESIWQKSYYEHGIRNRQDYLEIWRYIDNNPAKWNEDQYYNT